MLKIADHQTTGDTVFSATKNVTAIADNVFTATWTLSIPNATSRAVARVTYMTALGAGGAVGAGEATATITYEYAITRFAAAATVTIQSSAFGSATAPSSGAATNTTTAQVGSVTGANSATQTIPLEVRIVKGSGSSDNHTARVRIELYVPEGSAISAS